MNLVKKINLFIESLEEREFRLYTGTFLGVVLIVCILFFFRYRSVTSELLNRIDDIDEQRQEIGMIIAKSQQVKKQRQEVDAILAQDEAFKLGRYFSDVLDKLLLADKKTSVDYSHIDHENAYRESILKAQLSGMNMKNITELLYEIEQNNRVYVKSLEIVKSKKQNKVVDILVIIATLESKILNT